MNKLLSILSDCQPLPIDTLQTVARNPALLPCVYLPFFEFRSGGQDLKDGYRTRCQRECPQGTRSDNGPWATDNIIPALQVLRYSALVAGLFYGAYHQSSITANAKRAEADREYARQERLIQQAKAEWKKKTAPKDTQNNGSMLPAF